MQEGVDPARSIVPRRSNGRPNRPLTAYTIEITEA
jgi:hypothetical protein